MTQQTTYNQHPEQQARDIIDQKLEQAGWAIQSVKNFNRNSSLGVAVREYPTDSGPVDYLLFVDGDPVAMIEAKPENFGHKLNTVEEQSARYADSELNYIQQAEIAFLYESTGVVTRFTNRNDPAPRAREVFHFHRPETLQKWANEGKNTLRAKLKAIPALNPNHLSAAALGLRDCQLTAIENMQDSLAKDLPRALIQMATGAGKAVVFGGAFDSDSISSLAARLARLNKQLDNEQQQQITEITGGVPLPQLVKDLFHAINADEIHRAACEQEGISIDEMPSEKTVLQIQKQRVKAAARPLSMELITTLDDIRKQNEQKIDAEIDEVIHAGWAENDETLTQDFAEWIRSNKDEITALQIFYNQPYQRQALSLAMIKELATAIKKAKPKLAFTHIWQAYARLDNVSEQVESELTALVSLVRRVIGIDDKITPFSKTVRKNFQTWTFEHNARADKPLTEEQMQWLTMIRDHIITSFAIEGNDFELTPFNQHGGLGQAYDVLSGVVANDQDFNTLLNEINRQWTA